MEKLTGGLELDKVHLSLGLQQLSNVDIVR